MEVPGSRGKRGDVNLAVFNFFVFWEGERCHSQCMELFLLPMTYASLVTISLSLSLPFLFCQAYSCAFILCSPSWWLFLSFPLDGKQRIYTGLWLGQAISSPVLDLRVMKSLGLTGLILQPCGCEPIFMELTVGHWTIKWVFVPT